MKTKHLRNSSIACVLFVAAACSGTSGQSGQVRAHVIGAKSDLAAPRVDALDLGFTAACGPGGAKPGQGSLIRFPYLQQVTPNSAQVLWGSADAGPYTVDVTAAGGEKVGSFEARVDDSGAVAGGQQHIAELDGLEPASVYCYSIHDGNGEVLAPTGFRTAPEAGAPVTFAAFGDSGEGGPDQQAVFEQLQTVRADLLLGAGDLAYDSGTVQQFEDNFFAMYDPLLASVPVYPTSGNHEYHTAEAAPFRSVFSLPENGGEAGKERWYSFDWGDVHFVALDTERVGPEQAEWLEQDLSQNTRPWTVAIAHKGPYSSGSHGSNMQFRKVLSPILEGHGVQLVLSGHDHDYERVKKMGNTTYVVTGGGGKDTRSVGHSSFTEFSVDVLHFVYVTIDGPDMRLYAIDASGQEFDFAHLTRGGGDTLPRDDGTLAGTTTADSTVP